MNAIFSNFVSQLQQLNILCLVLLDPIKIFRLPYMKSTSDEEVEKFLEAFSRRISLFVLVESVRTRPKQKREMSRNASKNFQLPN